MGAHTSCYQTMVTKIGRSTFDWHMFCTHIPIKEIRMPLERYLYVEEEKNVLHQKKSLPPTNIVLFLKML